MRVRTLRPSYANYGVNNPFNLWLHKKGIEGVLDSKQLSLSVVDIDLVISRRIGRRQYWMICEFKLLGDDISYAQSQILKMLQAAIKPIIEINVWGQICQCVFCGVHVIRANRRDIEQATEIWIDNRKVTHDDLLRFVKFEAPWDWYSNLER